MTDPSNSKARFLSHVVSLLHDDRLRIDTTLGRRPVASMLIERKDAGDTLDVRVCFKKWLSKPTVGRLVARFVDKPVQLTSGDVQKITSEVTTGTARGVPTTILIASASGFEVPAREQADRRSDRTVILIEPNSFGGWNVHGPAETKAINDLFDVETDEEKRSRLYACIATARAAYDAAGLGADKLLAGTGLPLAWVENELRTFAGKQGLVAKRVSGTLTLLTPENPLAIHQEGPLA